MLTSYLKDFRVLFLVGLILLLAALDLMYGGPNGLHLGVEFIGGTQIPVQLEHSVNPATMASLITTLQGRLSTFGLKQITIEGVGDSQVFVSIPSSSPAEVESTISLIESQGVFQGVVNGREAINGEGLIPGSIGATTPLAIGNNVSWAVNFFITPEAAAHFSKTVFGQANRPLYMFLDRLNNGVVLINSSLVRPSSTNLFGANQSALLQAIQQATALGNATIPVQIYNPDLSNMKAVLSFLSSNRGKYAHVVLAHDAPLSLIENITLLNYSLTYVTVQNMTPEFGMAFGAGGTQGVIINSWPAIGLLSSPVLSPGITNGTVGQSYQVSGFSPQSVSLQEKEKFAIDQSNMIASILRGGALPVHVIVGIPTTIPPTLGSHFKLISALALLVAIFLVSLTIGIRYKKIFLIFPIVFTTLAELFIIGSIIGLIGTIDLAAVAGMIAVIGTGVDAQIIITDEVLKHNKEHGFKLKLGNAFFIIWADATLLIVAMMPLLFSTTLVSIIGFAESTILGVLFGAFITRPAYGAIVTRYYSKENAKENEK